MKKKEDEYVRFTLLAANKPESSNFKMKRFFPPSVNVPVEDIIFDEKTGSQRKIRYIPGEKSIFADEQSIKEMPKSVPRLCCMMDGKLFLQKKLPFSHTSAHVITTPELKTE